MVLLTFWLCPGVLWFKGAKPDKCWTELLSHNWMVVGKWVSESEEANTEIELASPSHSAPFAFCEEVED